MPANQAIESVGIDVHGSVGAGPKRDELPREAGARCSPQGKEASHVQRSEQSLAIRRMSARKEITESDASTLAIGAPKRLTE